MTKVVNSPCAASLARVDCLPYSSQSGFIDKPSSSQTTPARVRTGATLSPIHDHEAYFRATAGGLRPARHLLLSSPLHYWVGFG